MKLQIIKITDKGFFGKEILEENSCKNCSVSFLCKKNKNIFMKNTSKDYKAGDILEIKAFAYVNVLFSFFLFIFPIINLIFSYYFAKNFFNLTEKNASLISFCSLIISYIILKLISKILENKVIITKENL